VVDDDPARVATGWLGDHVMLGAERHAGGLQARGQYHPATVHWRRPDGGVGWLRLVHHGPTEATASEGRLTVTCRPHPRRGPGPIRWEGSDEALEVTPHRWACAGLTLDIATDGMLRPGAGLTLDPAPGGTTTISLTVR
jgi:hypothetical protein